MAEELVQSPPEYHVDDDTTYDFQENEFEQNKESLQTLDLNESLESDVFVDELKEAVKSKKIKRKKDVKKNISR